MDTTDGALMMSLYTSKAFSRDKVAILYYSIVLTGITVVVSAFIGTVQVLSLVANVAEPEGSFWDGLDAIGEHFDIIGGSICGVFLLAGLGSILVYKPWRRRMEQKRAERRFSSNPNDGFPEEAPIIPDAAPMEPSEDAASPPTGAKSGSAPTVVVREGSSS